MNGDYAELTFYLDNSKKNIPHFKPDCENAFADKDRWGHAIYKCRETEKNCVSTQYLNGIAHEPIIISDAMKKCENNPKFKVLEKKAYED
jgi:hypothetical protein